MRIGANHGVTQEELLAELPSMVSQAADKGFPPGVQFQDCQVVVEEEALGCEDGVEDWKGSLLIDTMVSMDSQDYQEWYWDNGRKTREQSLNQSLEQGQGPVLWVSLSAV